MSRTNMHKKKSSSAKPKKTITTLNRRVSKLENSIEVKRYDFYSTFSLGASANHIHLVNNVSQGDDLDQRIGEEIFLKSLETRLKISGLFASQAQTIRCCLICDKQSNGATGIQLTTGPSPVPLTQAIAVFDNRYGQDYISMPHNYATRERYIFLYDQTYALNRGDDTVDQVMPLMLSHNLYSAKIRYSSSSGSFMTNREYFWVFMSDLGVINVDCNTRLLYTDA